MRNGTFLLFYRNHELSLHPVLARLWCDKRIAIESATRVGEAIDIPIIHPCPLAP